MKIHKEQIEDLTRKIEEMRVTIKTHERAPTRSSFEVEHDFLKTVLPIVILKLVCRPPNFTKFLNP